MQVAVTSCPGSGVPTLLPRMTVLKTVGTDMLITEDVNEPMIPVVSRVL